MVVLWLLIALVMSAVLTLSTGRNVVLALKGGFHPPALFGLLSDDRISREQSPVWFWFFIVTDVCLLGVGICILGFAIGIFADLIAGD